MQWGDGLYPVLLPAPPKGCLVDAEDLGRLLQRSGGRQNAANMLLLDLFQAHQIPYGRSGLRTGEGPGKNLDTDPVERQRMEARSTTLRNSGGSPATHGVSSFSWLLP